MPSEYESRQGPSESLEAAVSRRTAEARRSGKNRGRLDTVAEIVNGCNGGANKSRIMLVANVNSVVATELLEKLQSSALVASRREEGNSIMYYPTQGGMQFVRRYSDLLSMLCPGLVPPSKLKDAGRAMEAWI
ncbi:MAG: winged helix-turn-helix domain-containing protein [Nitrososphaerales archaeon]|nr:winged helix-turn-helix domain-containing protein [Nitrososphaerales archaeon]